MCDLCRSQGDDYKFRNGNREELYTRSLFNVFPGHLVKVKLCFLHDSDLFLMGEARFVNKYPKFISTLSARKGRAQERNLPFVVGNAPNRNLSDLF